MEPSDTAPGDSPARDSLDESATPAADSGSGSEAAAGGSSGGAADAGSSGEPTETGSSRETAEVVTAAPGGPTASSTAPAGSGSPPARPRRFLTPYDVVLSLLLIAGWLIPINWVGATKRDFPYLPDWLRHQHRISCLFINEVKGWQTYQLQVQRGGSGRWEEMSEENYFELPVFGYRSRLHRVLGHSYKRGKGAARMKEIGRYIKDRYDQLNPEGPSLDALRFVRIYMTNEMLAKQTGHFKPMQPSEVPASYVLYFGEMRFDGARATHSGWGRTAAASTAARSPKAPAATTRAAQTAEPPSSATAPTAEGPAAPEVADTSAEGTTRPPAASPPAEGADEQ